MRTIVFLTIFVLAFHSQAIAQSNSCDGIKDDKERLACFDELSKRPKHSEPEIFSSQKTGVKFSVRFPASPEPASPEYEYEEDTDVKSDKWTTMRTSDLFKVTAVTFTFAPSPKEHFPHLIRSRIGSDKLLGKVKRIRNGSTEGRELSVRQSDGVERAAIYIGGRRLWYVIYAGPIGSENKPEVDEFFGSFRLLE